MKGETMSRWDEKAQNDAVQSGKGPGEFGSKFIRGGYKKPDRDPILAHKINKEYKRNKKEILKVTWFIYAAIIFLVAILFWVG